MWHLVNENELSKNEIKRESSLLEENIKLETRCDSVEFFLDSIVRQAKKNQAKRLYCFANLELTKLYDLNLWVKQSFIMKISSEHEKQKFLNEYRAILVKNNVSFSYINRYVWNLLSSSSIKNLTLKWDVLIIELEQSARFEYLETLLFEAMKNDCKIIVLTDNSLQTLQLKEIEDLCDFSVTIEGDYYKRSTPFAKYAKSNFRNCN